jgi:hypothetical protein
MFADMKKGSWTISTSTYDDFFQEIHEDKITPVTNALNVAKRSYSVSNEIIDDTWITWITLEETC